MRSPNTKVKDEPQGFLFRGILSEYDTKWTLVVSRVCLGDWTPLPVLRYARSLGTVFMYTYYIDGITTPYRTERGLMNKLKELGIVES